MQTVKICCSSMCQLFKEDLVFKLSLHGVKAIAVLVNKKKGNVPPLLVSTFLSLNIKVYSKILLTCPFRK